jgi:hypothetical protein
VASTDKTSVSIRAAVWNGVSGLPNRPVEETRRRPPVEAPAPTSDAVAPLENGGGIELMQWLPWAIGGTVLVGVGAFFLLRKPARKPVRNRRRRRSTRRRRRR